MTPTWDATEYFVLAVLAGIAAVVCYLLSAACLKQRGKSDAWFMAKLGTSFAFMGAGTAFIADSGGNFGSLVAIVGITLLCLGLFGLCRWM